MLTLKMTFKTLSLILFFYSSLYCVKAQTIQNSNIEVNFSKPYETIDATTKLYSSNSDYVMALKINKKTIDIQLFDNQKLNLINRKTIEIDKDADIEAFETINDKFYLFYGLKLDKKSPYILYKMEIKPADLEVETTPFISRISSTYKFKYFQESGELLVCDLPYADEGSLINITIFDKTLEPKWSKNIERPYDNFDISINDFILNNSNEASVLIKIDTTYGHDLENPEENIFFELYHANKLNNKISHQKIYYPGKEIKTLKFNKASNGLTYLGGYYKEIINDSIYNGICLLQLNNKGIVEQEDFYEIPLTILNQNLKNGEELRFMTNKQKEDYEPGNLSVNYISNADGSIYITGDIYKRAYFISNSRDAQAKNYYQDLIICKVGNNGSVEWVKNIPKNQYFGEYYNSTSSIMPFKNHISFNYLFRDFCQYIFYLDSSKNIDLKYNEVPSAHKIESGGDLIVAKVDNKAGKVTKQSLFNSMDVNNMPLYHFSKMEALKLSDNRIAVEAYKKDKEDVWVILEVK